MTNRRSQRRILANLGAWSLTGIVRRGLALICAALVLVSAEQRLVIALEQAFHETGVDHAPIPIAMTHVEYEHAHGGGSAHEHHAPATTEESERHEPTTHSEHHHGGGAVHEKMAEHHHHGMSSPADIAPLMLAAFTPTRWSSRIRVAALTDQLPAIAYRLKRPPKGLLSTLV